MKKYLLTMLAVLVGSNMWAQSFSYDKSNKTLTISVTTDLSNDNAAAGKVQAEMATDKPETVIVNGGGIVNNAFLRSILYSNYSTNSFVHNLDMGKVYISKWEDAGFRASVDDSYKYYSLNVKSVVLPKVEDGIFPNNVFYKASDEAKLMVQGFFSIENLVFPEGYKEIADYAVAGFYNNGKGIKSVTFPSSLKKIGVASFYGDGLLLDLKLNEGLEIIGNSAFGSAIAIENKTLSIPSTVQFIGPGAFLNRLYQDVYFLGSDAPLCPYGPVTAASDALRGAFDDACLMGNNGFRYHQDKHPMAEKKQIVMTVDGKELLRDNPYCNRENYIANNDNLNLYIMMIHYPKNLTEKQRAKYIDVTRKYVTWVGNEHNEKVDYFDASATQKIQGYEGGEVSYSGSVGVSTSGVINPGFKDTYVGDQLIWPSMTQMTHSFIMATNGKNWKGDDYVPELSQDQIDLLREQGFSKDKYTVEQLQKIAYVGTRQFVLGTDDATTTPDFPLPLKKGGRWWTLCVPFNMTKKMIDESMGKGTQVCRFSSVKREMDMDGRGRGAGKRGHHITLQFRNDVYKHKYVRNADGSYPEWDPIAAACSDDDIVIYAHEPYMVYPTKNSDDPKDFVVKEYEAVPGSPLPTVIQSVEIQYSNGMQNQSENSAGDYRFIGNYINQTVNDKNVNVPVNSYFYGKATASDTESKFWFWPYDAALTWPSNKCTVQTTDASLGMQDAIDFFNFEAGLSASSKTQSSLFGEDVFDDNGTTSIDKVEIVAGEDSQEIYNISGQLVSTNGTFTGLPKGIYVKGGKKFIVK